MADVTPTDVRNQRTWAHLLMIGAILLSIIFVEARNRDDDTGCQA